MINGVLDRQTIHKTRIPQPHDIPPELSVNVVQYPLNKHLKDGRTYDCRKLF